MSLEQSVLICDQVNPTLNEILEKNGLKITYEPEITPEQISEKIENFDVVIVRSRTKLTKDLIEKASKCKIIARVGVGLDNIDQKTAKEKNIRVINAVEGAMNAGMDAGAEAFGDGMPDFDAIGLDAFNDAKAN